MPRRIRLAGSVASMTVNTDGGVFVTGCEGTRMIAVEFQFSLYCMAGFAFFAVFQLKFTVVPGRVFRMRILPDPDMAR